MEAAAVSLGTTLAFTAKASSITLAATVLPPPPPSSTPCKRKFTHWCLDNTSLDKADVAGIIVGGCIFVIIVLAAVAFLGVHLVRRRSRSRNNM